MNDPIVEHALSVYIPVDRRHALVQGDRLPDRTSGAALFADVSGFTPLTEALTQALGSRRGAEELARQLNLVYDALIAEVNRYGGSVISFSGDAITCWFDEEGVQFLTGCGDPSNHTRPIGSAPLRATACALAMQQAMQQFAAIPLPGGETVTLAVKAAVASGPVRRFLVGDPNIQLIDALVGQTLARMAAAERLANRGDVVVDAQTAAHLGEQAQVVEWRADTEAGETGERFAVLSGLQTPVGATPWPSLAPDALRDAPVHLWLLPAVYERLRQGLGEFLTELRPAVALFLRFGGIDYDGDQAAGAKLDAYVCWVQGVVGRYEGALLQLTIGDKGSYLYAAFGAPIAHEDDGRRAVSAALELRAPPPRLSFIGPVQIGISQGTMRTGAYGGTTRRTYGVLGDEVNLAARLMQRAAPGEVLVGSRVQKGVGGGFAWGALLSIQVKGKREPVPVARLVGRTRTRAEAVSYTGALIGREVELVQLMEFVQPMFQGSFAGMAYVYGEAGVGKSRLVYELRQRLLSSSVPTTEGWGGGASWFTCPAEAILRQSLHPFKHFLREYFDQYADSTEEENKAHFAEVLGALIADLQKAPGFSEEAEHVVGELERTRPFLGALVDLHWEGSLYEQLEPKLRFENTLVAFRTLIMAESRRRPVVLHVEDAHWMDADSQELLGVLVRNIGAYPFAVVLTGRYGDDGSRFVVDVDADVPRRTVDLNELSPEGIRAMAAQVLADGRGDSGLARSPYVEDVASEGDLGGHFPIADELAAFLAEKTNGNPLFVEQLVLDLRERGLVEVDGGRPERPMWVMVSEEMVEVPATINAVLIARLDRLAARVKAAVQTAAVLGREFEVLILSHMLRDDARMPAEIRQAEEEEIWLAISEVRYMFRHALLRDTAYDMQLRARLRELHALAGEVMEQVYVADLEPHYADLAYHYGKAGNAGQELHYAQLAGGRAAAQFANQEAIADFSQALRAAGYLDPDATIKQRQVIHAALGELLTTIGQYDQASEHLRQSLALAVERDDPDGQAHACRWLARMHELRGEYPPALDWIQQGLAALESDGRSDREPECLHRETSEAIELLLIAGLIHTRQGDYDNALQQCHQALCAADRLGELTVLARAYNLLGHISRLRGDSATAVEHFERALDLYRKASDIHGQATSHNQIAAACLYMGRLREAERQCRLAREIFGQIGDVYNRVFVDNNLGEILLKQGDLDGALTSYQEGLRALEQIGGSSYVLGALHNNLGAAFVRRGEITAARRHLRTAQEYFEQAQARDFLPEMHRHFAEAALLAGELDEAQARDQQALNLARELSMRGEEGSGLRVLGETFAAKGRFNLAEEYLCQSLAVLEEVGDEYEKARTQLALAKSYAVQGKLANGLAALEQCVPVFERLGAELDLSTARALREEMV